MAVSDDRKYTKAFVHTLLEGIKGKTLGEVDKSHQFARTGKSEKITGIDTLFEHLCYILIKEKAWTNNVDDLKKFFKEAKKKESPIITLTGEHATYIENNKE